MHQAVISGTGLYTPTESISNDELVASFNAYVERHNAEHADDIAAELRVALTPSSADFIEKASGIRSRFVMNKAGILDINRMVPHLPKRGDDELSLLASMGVAAANHALQQAGKTAADVDMVIVACSNLQRAYPAVAVEIQAALGITGYGFDMNVACSSATFGLQTAVNNIQTGQARAVLVISPEITSAHLNWRDRDSHFIFGDACTAILVERADLVAPKLGFDILHTQLRTDFSNAIRNNFGFLNRCEAEHDAPESADTLFRQQGRKVFKEVCPMAAEVISDTVTRAGFPVEAVKSFWLHQANLNMNRLISKLLLGHEADAHQAPVILDRYANTSSAGSVIAFHLHHQHLVTGDLGVLCSFGAGYSIGCLLLKKR